MISESAIAATTAPTEALDGARDDQERLRVGQPTEQGRERELRDAEQEHALLAVEVAEAAGEQQEPAEGEQVRVHHPGQRRLREAEIRADRRQGDVHDRGVEHDHQIGQTEDVQREPAPAGREVGQGR
jgi:hypothetical protein